MGSSERRRGSIRSLISTLPISRPALAIQATSIRATRCSISMSCSVGSTASAHFFTSSTPALRPGARHRCSKTHRDSPFNLQGSILGHSGEGRSKIFSSSSFPTTSPDSLETRAKEQSVFRGAILFLLGLGSATHYLGADPLDEILETWIGPKPVELFVLAYCARPRTTHLVRVQQPLQRLFLALEGGVGLRD